MSNLFWLIDGQVAWFRPYFPKSHRKPRIDDRCVLSGIIFINNNGSRRSDAPEVCGAPKAPYNRLKRWNRVGVFAKNLTELAAQTQETKVIMIDAPHAKAHRTTSTLRFKKGRGRLIRRTKGGLNSNLHILADAKGRPIQMSPSEDLTSDYIRARALLSPIPEARALLADRGYDAGWFRNALIKMGLFPRIPSRARLRVTISHDTDFYRMHHRIENMFAGLKDRRRIATSHDRCPILFLSACALAATVIYWL
ncbi:IS5 family transposase [Seohaeicola saemankumensis]|uniref:IS5 family transposase n=1 Tax=Seohaeicola saemankumensis TaxID=481181 RepID=UPI003AF38B7B